MKICGCLCRNQHQIGRVGGKDDASKLHHSRSSKPGRFLGYTLPCQSF